MIMSTWYRNCGNLQDKPTEQIKLVKTTKEVGTWFTRVGKDYRKKGVGSTCHVLVNGELRSPLSEQISTKFLRH